MEPSNIQTPSNVQTEQTVEPAEPSAAPALDFSALGEPEDFETEGLVASEPEATEPSPTRIWCGFWIAAWPPTARTPEGGPSA